MKYIKLQMLNCYFKCTFQKVISITGLECLESSRTSPTITDVQDPARADFSLVIIILTARKILILIDCKSSYHVPHSKLVR